MFKKIVAIIMVLIGAAVVVLGVSLLDGTADHSVDESTFRYKADDYNLPYAAFGGDFYTEIYKGSDYIVDILDDINKSTETIVKAENAIYEAAIANIDAVDTLTNTIREITGMIVIVMGLGLFAFGLNFAAASFEKNRSKEKTTDITGAEGENILQQ